jgi:AhpC/TSA family
MKRMISAVVLGLLISANSLAADAQPDKSVGQKIPNFKLNNYLGTSHKASEWSKSKALVVVFIGVECPVAKLVGPRLGELAAKYAFLIDGNKVRLDPGNATQGGPLHLSVIHVGNK